MNIPIKVPTLPESITEAVVAAWLKKPGDPVSRGEPLLELETDKIMLEVPAAYDGVLESISKPAGSKVKADESLGTLTETTNSDVRAKPTHEAPKEKEQTIEKTAPVTAPDLSPSVRRLVTENDLDVETIKGTGKKGRVTREDVETHLQPHTETKPMELAGSRPEKRVPMSPLRARVAERLVEAQHTAAMLTTFNEINMQPVMDLRARYKDSFEKTHGVKLGFMSFFVKAVIEALKRFPVLNASIDGKDVLYHGYYDIGIAVSTPRGLVVPVIRDAETRSMADIEKAIASYAEKAKAGKLTMEEITGGTFTVTNGGTFGSMLSTPIINMPQCAILGMHNIVKRAIVEDDQIVARPIMYVALSYDHRLVDGRDSVSFLVTIKQLLEDPSRFLLGM